MNYLRFLTLLFLLFTATAYCKTPLDSLVDARVNTQIQKHLDRLVKTNDSLRNELVFFRAKEDQYSLLVDRQGTHFEFLIGALLAVAGLVGFGFYNSMRESVKSLREELSNIIALANEKHVESTALINETTRTMLYKHYETLGIGDALGELNNGFVKKELEGVKERVEILQLIVPRIIRTINWMRAYRYASTDEEKRISKNNAKLMLTMSLESIGMYMQLQRPNTPKVHLFVLSKIAGIHADYIDRIIEENTIDDIEFKVNLFKLREVLRENQQDVPGVFDEFK